MTERAEQTEAWADIPDDHEYPSTPWAEATVEVVTEQPGRHTVLPGSAASGSAQFPAAPRGYILPAVGGRAAVSDPDLAALTEAANQRLREQRYIVEDGEPNELVDYQVRAVLEALPREWGYQNCGTSACAWVSLPGVVLSDSAGEKAARASAWSRNAAGNAYRVVWRAVGPPIPAEEGT